MVADVVFISTRPMAEAGAQEELVIVKSSAEAKTKSTSVLAVTAPPSATTKTSSTSKPPLALTLPVAVTMPVWVKVVVVTLTVPSPMAMVGSVVPELNVQVKGEPPPKVSSVISAPLKEMVMLSPLWVTSTPSCPSVVLP